MVPGPRYKEVAPPAHLVADVECLWVVETGAGHPGYRVLPDGCMDVVVQPEAGGAVRLEVVGAMTKLRRLFVAQVGLGPKQLARILRFQRAVALAHGKARPDWAGIAADCGYTDQAHLVHEFGALAGCSPGRFDSRTVGQDAKAPAAGAAVAVFYNPLPQPPS